MKYGKKTIVFDLDHTICIPGEEPDTHERYALAKPIESTIKHMHKLKEDGYYITILTARRMVTHDGNISKILEDVEDITMSWLERHDVPFDEFVWGKPWCATYYVDDKAMNIEDFEKWMSRS